MANFPSCGLEHSNFASQCDNTIELKWQILLQLLPQFITYCNSKTTIQICSYRVMVETKWYRLFCSISSGSLDDTNLRSDRHSSGPSMSYVASEASQFPVTTLVRDQIMSANKYGTIIMHEKQYVHQNAQSFTVYSFNSFLFVYNQ